VELMFPLPATLPSVFGWYIAKSLQNVLMLMCLILLPRLRIRVKTPISLPEQDWMAYTAYYLKRDYVFVIQKGVHTEVWRVLCWRCESFT
jgi:hypothetical protein